MTREEREVMWAVRQTATATLAAAWPAVNRRPATIDEAMAQRWVGLAVLAELFRRGQISVLQNPGDII